MIHPSIPDLVDVVREFQFLVLAPAQLRSVYEKLITLRDEAEAARRLIAAYDGEHTYVCEGSRMNGGECECVYEARFAYDKVVKL